MAILQAVSIYNGPNFNLKTKLDLNLIFHKRGEEFGLRLPLFKAPIKIETTNISKTAGVHFVLKETETINLDSPRTPCKYFQENSDYLQCAKTQLSLKLLPLVNCSIAGMAELFENVTMPECRDRSSAASTFLVFLKYSKHFIENSSDFGCHVPCTETNYVYQQHQFHRNSWIEPHEKNSLPEDVFGFGISYSTLLIEEQITAFAYDFGTFLTAAGGNLGLFLGFSCLSVFLTMINYVQQWKK